MRLLSIPASRDSALSVGLAHRQFGGTATPTPYRKHVARSEHDQD